MSDGPYSYTPHLVSVEANATFVIPAADTLKLNTTPIDLIPAPGPGRVIVVRRGLFSKPAGVAGAGGGDLEVGYKDGAGILDVTRASSFSAGVALRSVSAADHARNGIAALVNTAIVVRMLTTDMTGNDQDMTIHILFDIWEL